MATVRRISPMTAALKKYSDTKRSIFSTAKEQGEQQRASRESIEFQQRGLDLQKDYADKKKKTDTLSTVLNLASIISSNVAKGQAMQEGGEQLTVEAGGEAGDFNLYQTTDKFGADRPGLNFLEGMGQGIKSAFGIYDKNYEIGGKTYSQNELSYLSKFPGADMDKLGYKTPPITSETLDATIQEVNSPPSISETATDFSQYTNDYGEALVDFDFSTIDFTSGDSLMMPKIGDDGQPVVNPSTNKVELEVWTQPTKNIDPDVTAAQYYTELSSRKDAVSNLSNKLEDAMWAEIDDDLEFGFTDEDGVFQEPLFGFPHPKEQIIPTSYKGSSAIIKDGILSIEQWVPDIVGEEGYVDAEGNKLLPGYDKGQLIFQEYDKDLDSQGFYDSKLIKQNQTNTMNKNMLIQNYHMNPEDINPSYSISTNLFYKKYGKENVIREFGDSDFLNTMNNNILITQVPDSNNITIIQADDLQMSTKNIKLKRKLEKWQEGMGRHYSGEYSREANRAAWLSGIEFEGEKNRVLGLDETLDVAYLDNLEDADSSVLIDKNALEGFSKEDIEYAMEVWKVNFPNQQFTHEKYGYDWGQQMINKIGLETANQVTNLTPLEIDVPWKIPDTETRNFIMDELMKFHDIRISDKDKKNLIIENVLGEKDGIRDKNLTVLNNGNSQDSELEILNSLEEINEQITEPIDDGYSEDPTYGDPQESYEIDDFPDSEFDNDRNKNYVDNHNKKTLVERNFNDLLKTHQEGLGLDLAVQDKNEYPTIIDSLLIDKWKDFDDEINLNKLDKLIK